MTTQFKKGDRVRVVACSSTGALRVIGVEGRVVGYDDMLKRYVVELAGSEPGKNHWFQENELALVGQVGNDSAPVAAAEPEYTGGSVSYYQVTIANPTTQPAPYTAECNDIIEALGMSYAEGNAFKAIWRACAARTLGKAKRGYTDALYDAEKVVFFGERMVAMAKAKKTDGVER